MTASILGLFGTAHAVIDKLVTYENAVKGAEKEVKDLLVEVSSLSGIADGLHTLVKTMESQEFDKMMRAEHIYYCQKTLEEIGYQLDKFKVPEAENKLESVKRKMRWPLSSKDTMKLVSDVERHKSSLSLALSADTTSAVLKALGDLQELKTESQEKRRKETCIALDYEKTEVLSVLKIVDPSRIQATNWRLHQPGTGIWFVESESFKTWFARKNSNLWLRGIAGAGKSILTSLIVREVERLRSENAAMAYFYRDYKDTATQEPLNLLCSLG